MSAEKERRQETGLLQILGATAAGGFLLFMWVWWPIQAERSLLALKKKEKELSLKKSEREDLKQRYIDATSLTVLDGWASDHGPWKTPDEKNVVTIFN